MTLLPRTPVHYPDLQARRSRADLAIAMTITALVALISICVNALDSLQRFFGSFGQLRLTQWLINGLFCWLLVLLALAYWRWRQSERARRELKVVLDGINPDTLLVVSPQRTILMCNPTVTPMFGYSPKEVLHQQTDLLYEDRRVDPAKPREIYEELMRKGYHVGGATGRRRDGSRFPLEVITGELGECVGAVLLLRDITDRVREEERRHHGAEELHRWQYLESLGVLSGGVAHDFNNILTGVLGNADLALSTHTLSPDVRQNLQEIVQSAKRAAGICNELLTYAGKMRPRLEALDLANAIRAAREDVQEMVPPHIELRWEFSPEPMPVLADVRQLRQLLQNLLDNSSEAIGTHPGLITIRTGRRTCDQVLLNRTHGAPHPPAGDYAFMSVSDTGEGIPPDELARVFEPFYSTRFPGRGLGLAAAIGIVRGHHGVLLVESKLEQGSQFTVLIPIHT